MSVIPQAENTKVDYLLYMRQIVSGSEEDKVSETFNDFKLFVEKHKKYKSFMVRWLEYILENQT